MPQCFFATDLHGHLSRYEKLFAAIEEEAPDLVFLGGDLLPHAGRAAAGEDFFRDVLGAGLKRLQRTMGASYPHILSILGNDDPRVDERGIRMLEHRGLLNYVHNRRMALGSHVVYGYGIVHPTPFRNKDWEKYDVSRYVPPGAISPEEGFRTVPVESREIRYSTISQDLQALTGDEDLGRAVLLVHSPPSETKLDRVENDGKMVDHVPLDIHVGSIALRRFIEERQPFLTLHGHIHESTRLTGSWRDRIGATRLFNAAHDGPELALIRFELNDPDGAERELL
jgi:Icc-related predicted phosphoesterase